MKDQRTSELMQGVEWDCGRGADGGTALQQSRYMSLGCCGTAAVNTLIREEPVEAHSLRKEAANEHLSFFPFSHAKVQFFYS